MTWLAALLRWELRLQARSTRTRAAVAGYLLLCAAPPALIFFLSRSYPFGPATYLRELMKVQPLATLVLVVLLAGARADRESQERMWPVLSAAAATNAACLLGRWITLVLLLLPVAALPVAVAAALATAAGNGRPDPGSWLWTWGMLTAVRVITASAAWLGLVTIAGGELAALAVYVLGGGLLRVVLNRVLFYFQLAIGAASASPFNDFYLWLSQLKRYLGDHPETFFFDLNASEAPVAPETVLGPWLSDLAPGLALTGLVLGLAVAYVRRTERDLRPRPIRPDHPLRTYHAALLRTRERLTPQAALPASDRLAVVLGVVVLAVGFTFVFQRHTGFQRLADERYRVETADELAPLAAAVVPGLWRIEGKLRGDGSVAVDFRGTLHNRGAEPVSRLAFSLDEHLAVADLRLSGGRRAAVERHWDRLGIAVDPPLGPSESLELSCRLSGAPGDVRFSYWRHKADSFVTYVGRFRSARTFWGLSDLSKSSLERAVEPGRVELHASDLAPVPRYTAWTLTPYDDDGGREVPEEELRPEVDLEIDLAVPPGWFLADPCGHASRGGTSRLEGGCRTRIAEYEIYGGDVFETLHGEAVTIAVLGAHRRFAESYLEDLSLAARLASRAWPTVADFRDGLVAIELLPKSSYKRLVRGAPSSDRGFELKGKLLLFEERNVSFGSLPRANWLIAMALADKLLERRAVVPQQLRLFRFLYWHVTRHRMRTGRQKDARVSGPPWFPGQIKRPILRDGVVDDDASLLGQRLGAVLIDLEARIGPEAFQEALDAFLDEDGTGRFEELLVKFEEKGKISLRRFADDFLYGPALPELALEELSVERRPSGWEIRGRLRNIGTGEVVCPVFLRTELAVHRLLVTVGSETATPFRKTTRGKPFLAELDPDGTCHRLVGPGASILERVDLVEGKLSG